MDTRCFLTAQLSSFLSCTVKTEGKSLAEMSVQCLVTACVYLPRCLLYLKRETALSSLYGEYEFTASSWIA